MPNTHREIAAYNARIRRVLITLGFADVVALGAATTGFIDSTSLLIPTDGFLVGFDFNVKAVFTDGASGTLKVDVGKSGSTTLFLAGAANNLGAATGRSNGGTVAAPATSFQGGIQPRLSFTGNVNLSTFTAGSVEVAMSYFRATQVEGELRGTG